MSTSMPESGQLSFLPEEKIYKTSAAQRAANRKWQKENKEKCKLAYQKYRQSKKGKEARKRAKQKYESKPEVKEKKKLARKAYRQRPEVKERIKQQKKEYYKTPKGKEYLRRKRNKRNFVPKLLVGVRKRCRIALSKGIDIPYNLDIEYIKSILPKDMLCPALGVKIIPGGGSTKNSPSIDRIFPEKGYVKGNVVIVSFEANAIKFTATPDEIIKVGKFYKKLLEEMEDGSETD